MSPGRECGSSERCAAGVARRTVRTMLAHRRFALAAALACALALGAAWAPGAGADALPGDLDTSFGRGGGTVTTDFNGRDDPGFTDAALGLAIQGPRIVAAGRSGHHGGDFALAIYNRRGFLRHDKVETDFGGYDVAAAVAIGRRGGIFAAGSAGAAKALDRRFAIASYYPTGDRRAVFGGDGRVTTAFSSNAGARAIAIDREGRIVAAGFVGISILGGDVDMALARYLPDGRLDRRFDHDGKVVTGFGHVDAANAVAIQDDGRIVVAGRTGDDVALARYLPDGRLDTSFGGDGKVSTDFSGTRDAANAIALDDQGRIVVAGHAGEDVALARYLPSGRLDPGFGGGDGTTTYGILPGSNSANAIALQADGRIVVAGGTGRYDGADPIDSQGDAFLLRFTPTGFVDVGFHNPHLTALGGKESAEGVAIQDDGRIVVAGSTSINDGRFLLARYHAEPSDEAPTAPTSDAEPPDTAGDPQPPGTSTTGSSGAPAAPAVPPASDAPSTTALADPRGRRGDDPRPAGGAASPPRADQAELPSRRGSSPCAGRLTAQDRAHAAPPRPPAPGHARRAPILDPRRHDANGDVGPFPAQGSARPRQAQGPPGEGDRPGSRRSRAPHADRQADAPATRTTKGAMMSTHTIDPKTTATDGLREQLLAGLPVAERRLELAGISTAVLAGGDGPPIVLLHGPGEFAAKWLRVICR